MLRYTSAQYKNQNNLTVVGIHTVVLHFGLDTYQIKLGYLAHVLVYLTSGCYGNRFGWLTADTGSEAYLMESQHLIVANSNHDIMWYKVTNVDKETIQVSLVCSLAAAYMSSVSMKGEDVVIVT